MMRHTKKIAAFILTLSTLLTLTPNTVNAQVKTTDTTVATTTTTITTTCEQVDEDLYCITTITENKPKATSGISICSSKSTISASKTTEYKNSSGNTLWYVKVTGSFTYDGSTSKCNSASISAGSYNSAWKVSDRSSSTSGNTAIATATGTRYRNSLPVQSITKSVSLSCSKNGALQ